MGIYFFLWDSSLQSDNLETPQSHHLSNSSAYRVPSRLRPYLHPYLASKTFSTTLLTIPIMIWFSIPALIFLLHSLYCIIKKHTPKQTILYSIYTFIIVLTWLILICSVLINLLELFQLLTNINPVFLGMSLLACVNCVGGTSFATQTISPSQRSSERATSPPP